MVGKILIVDDVATNRIVFKVKLGEACFQPILAADGASCLRLAVSEEPDLILLDLTLPDIPGTEVLRQLRADPVTRDIPVVVLSARPDAEARLAALRAGADDFLCKPIDDQTMMARLRNLLRDREAVADLGQPDSPIHAFGQSLGRALELAEAPAAFEAPGVVALIANRAEAALRWRRDLAAVVADRIIVLSREEALAEGGVPRVAPDIFVIDANLGGLGGGLRLMSELRSRASTRHASICIVRAAGAEQTAAMAYDLGANDQVDAEVDPREMGLRLRGMLRRKRSADRIRASVQDGLRMAVIDPLTGLYNRRYALPQLAALSSRAQEDGAGFAVMVIDLDRFKSVNDRWGHAAGDAVLVEVARRLTENLRHGDLLARIGGEEFLVALPDSGLPEARATAERLRAAVQQETIALPGGAALSVTVSIGLAITALGKPLQIESVAALVDRADHALMLAKSDGRNKVTVSRTAA